MRSPRRTVQWIVCGALIAGVLAFASFENPARSAAREAEPSAASASAPFQMAEVKKRRSKPKPAAPADAPKPEQAPAPAAPPAYSTAPAPDATAPPAQTATPAPPLAPERLEIDVSTHSVAVTSVFKGTEIVIFGTVINGRQESPEGGYYEVVVTVEGRPTPAIVRRKDRAGGVWVNARGIRFDGLPVYLAIAATHPLDEIAEPEVRARAGLGFLRTRLIPVRGIAGLDPATVDDFKSAFQRLKEKDGLYVTDEFGVGFIGRSLFRASIRLPANIPVGPLTARTFLFHDGDLLATQTSQVFLRRSGIERLIYDFAFDFPVIYGLLAVLLASAASLGAAFLLQRWRD